MTDSQPNGSQSSAIWPLTCVVDACDRFEMEWRGGAALRIETFLDRVEPGYRERLLGELLAIEVELRIEHGESPTPNEFRHALPRLGPRDHRRVRAGPLCGRGRARRRVRRVR